MTEEPKVLLFRVPGFQNGVTEYIMGTEVDGGKGGKTITDILRLICTWTSRQVIRKDANGQVVTNPQGDVIADSVTDHNWTFQTDTHFTDFEATVHLSNILLSREVGADEGLYQDYIRNIDALIDAKAQEEAQAAAIAQKNAILNNRKNRRAAGKKTKTVSKGGSKKRAGKKKARRRLASV